MKGDNKKNSRQERIDNYERKRKEMEEARYEEYSGIISVLKANLLAIVTGGPFCVLAFFIYMIRWGKGGFTIDGRNLLFFLVMFFATVFIHEILHGVCWVWVFLQFP